MMVNTRRVSVLILYNEKKEVLLQHRTKDAPRLADYWAFFGGGIEEGETEREGLTRELLEELEYKVSKPVLILTQRIATMDTPVVKYIFIEKYDSSQKLILHEGQGMAWWRFEDLDNLLIADHDREALLEIRKILNPHQI